MNKSKCTIFIIGVIVLGSVLCGCSLFKSRSSNSEVKEKDKVYELRKENIRDDGKGTKYVDNIIVVTMSDNYSLTDVEEIAKKINGKIVGHINSVDQYQIKIKSKNQSELISICSNLEKNDKVLIADYDTVVESETLTYRSSNDGDESKKYNAPNDDWGEKTEWNCNNPNGNNWWSESVYSVEAWDYVKKNSSLSKINVGVVDAGFDSNHEDLNINVLNPSDNIVHMHGTAVASIIGAKMNNKKGIAGIAPNAKLYCYGCFKSKSDKYFSTSKIFAGIASCIDKKCKVINLSIGNSSYLKNDNMSIEKKEIDNQAKRASVFMAKYLSKGYDFIIVQSAGNGAGNGIGVDAINNGLFCSITEDNCKTLENVTVDDVMSRIVIAGANKEPDSRGRVYLTDFSNGGSQVDISAPGENVYYAVPNNTYSKGNGTSFSAPIVTGTVAYLWGLNKESTGSEIKEKLVSNNLFFAMDSEKSHNTKGSYPIVNVLYETYSIVGEPKVDRLKSSEIKNIYENAKRAYLPVTMADTSGKYVLVGENAYYKATIPGYDSEKAVRKSLHNFFTNAYVEKVLKKYFKTINGKFYQLCLERGAAVDYLSTKCFQKTNTTEKQRKFRFVSYYIAEDYFDEMSKLKKDSNGNVDIEKIPKSHMRTYSSVLIQKYEDGKYKFDTFETYD